MQRLATATMTMAALLLLASAAQAVKAPKANLETNRLYEYRTLDPAVQAQMTASSAAWQRFTQMYGDGWHVDWDQRSGTALRIYGRPLPLVSAKADRQTVLDAADVFLGSIEDLVRVQPGQLALSNATKVRNTWYVKYDRLASGLHVDGAAVELRVKSGAITLIKIDTHPAADAAAELPRNVTRMQAANLAAASIQTLAGPAKVHDAGRLVVFPLAQADGYDYRLAWVNEVSTEQIKGRWRTHVDAVTGDILRRENLIRYVSGTIRGRVEPRTIGDSMEDLPMPNIQVSVAGSSGDADDQGSFNVASSGTGEVSLYGARTNVNNQAGSDGQASFTASSSPADHTLTTADATQAEIAAYKHTETVKDWARRAAPDLAWVDTRMGVNVNINQECNAYWDGSTTNFFSEGSQCNNTARIADVVYHEFGHGFHQNIMVSGTLDGSIGEGSGDYIAVTQTEDPHMAVGFFLNGGYIRNADNNKVYPQDLQGEPHADGEIWVAAMWDLRGLLVERYGKEQGVLASDTLFANILRSGPRFDDLYSEALLADDDDNDLSNGTPHQCEIDEAFGLHGLSDNPGGGSGSFLPVSHEEVVGPISAEKAVKIVTSAGGGNSACAVGDPSQVLLKYTTDRGASFGEVAMSPTGTANEFSADIPAQADGTVVQYYIEASKDTVVSTSPPRAPDNLYGFYVGKLETVFFDDFEQDLGWTHGLDRGDATSEGADDWQRGTPAGAAGDPAEAYSGTNVWGNDLGFEGYNGLYQPDVTNWLESPVIDCSGCKGARLQFRRWVQVEDALYDHATIYVNGTQVWQNASTTGGEKHRLDAHWTFHDIDISDLADGQSEVTIRFELDSDPGLEFGGWNIDDVAVVQSAASSKGDGDGPGSCACTMAPQTRRGPLAGTLLALMALAGAIVIRRRRS